MHKMQSDLQMPYLRAIQAVPGNTASQKLCWIGKLTSYRASGDPEQLPQELLPILQTEIAVNEKKYEDITSALKSEDWTIVNRAFKATWFFDGSHKNIVNAEYFCERVFPYVSMNTRGRIVTTLANRLTDPELAQQLFTKLFVTPCFLAFGRHLKVPMVGTVASVFHDWLNEVSGNPMNPAYIPSFFSTYDQRMNFQERLINFLLSNYISTQIHYYTNSQLEFVKKSFGMDVPHIKDLYYDLSLYLVNSHHSLHGIRPTTTNVIEVGGLHIREDDHSPSPEVQKWLDESKDGCIYFTFGSMVRIETFSKELIEQFYASFEKIAPVRVLMKVAKKEDLLPGLPKNVMTQSWFPQISILKHKNIRAFITHGGGLGTQEAIYCGVPMIGIPLFGDQRINIHNYVNKKVAISLESINDVTEEKLTLALNNILKDPSYRENSQKLSKLFLDRPMSALNTSIFWVEYVAKYGNVLQSPAINLYWWQRNLLDVYAFILAVIITALCIVLFILRKLKNLLFGSPVCAKKDSAAIKSKKNK